MSEFLSAYGLFLAQLATFVVLVIVAVVLVAATRRRGRAEGLVVEHLNRRYEDSADELKVIIEQVKPAKCHVIYWDTRVAGHQVFEDGQFAVQDLKVKGGGGTDFDVNWTYMKENEIEPDQFIMFTDGQHTYHFIILTL